MKRLILCLLCGLLLCGCTARQANPLVEAEATAVPGVEPALHAAEASADNVTEKTVTLYFRYGDQGYLAAETRRVAVRRDQTDERAIVEALLAGPSAEVPTLRALFPDTVRLLDLSAGGDTLFVTFSTELLTADGIPSDWRQLPEWVEEAPLRRRLTMASLVCSLTENTGYTAVQVLLRRDGEAQSAFRLEQSYFLGEGTGVTEPMTRREELLSTPYRAALRVLAAWQTRDVDALRALIAGQPPQALALGERLDGARVLLEFEASAGSVTPPLDKATVNLSFRTADAYGEIQATEAYPLALVWEDGVWKLTDDTLQRLLKR